MDLRVDRRLEFTGLVFGVDDVRMLRTVAGRKLGLGLLDISQLHPQVANDGGVQRFPQLLSRSAVRELLLRRCELGLLAGVVRPRLAHLRHELGNTLLGQVGARRGEQAVAGLVIRRCVLSGVHVRL